MCIRDSLKGVRALCDEHGMLLILDEIQCGICLLYTSINPLHQRKDAVFRGFGIDTVFLQTVIDVVKVDENAYIFRRRVALLHTCF